MLNTLYILFGALLVVIIFLLFSRRYLWAPFQVFKELGINGPEPEPFFGNTRLRSKLGLLKFISFLREKYGPISGFYLGPTPNLLIFDLDILKQILVKEFDTFQDRTSAPDLLRRKKNTPRGLLTSQGEAWKINRRTLSPTFSAAKIKMMVPLLEKSVSGLLRKMTEIADSNTSTDILKVFGSFTMETIMATAFGRVIDIQGGENDELTDAGNLIFRGAEEGNYTSPVFIMPILTNFPWLVPIVRYIVSRSPRGLAVATIEHIGLDLINARKESGLQGKYKDLLQLMIDASVREGEEDPAADKKLSSERMAANCLAFFLAGYETTANTLSYTAYLLAINPDIQEILQVEIDNYMESHPDVNLYDASQEISYLDMTVQESLRLYPPAPISQRQCSKSISLNGLSIPEGATIIIPIANLHKDPQYWKDPDVFNPERFTADEKAKRPQLCYMPFGTGPRNCIGMRFAMLEVKVALIEILRKFTFVRSADTQVPLETTVGFTLAPKNGIYIKVIPRI